MNRLLFIVLFSMINNLFAEENCTISTEVENLSCKGTVRAKSISDLEIYKQNLGIKKNIAKNLLIDFDPKTDQDLSISTPCQVTVSKDRKIEGNFSFCIKAKRGIVFHENQNIKVNNISLYSEDEIIIRHDSRIVAHDLILKSNGVTTYSKV